MVSYSKNMRNNQDGYEEIQVEEYGFPCNNGAG